MTMCMLDSWRIQWLLSPRKWKPQNKKCHGLSTSPKPKTWKLIGAMLMWVCFERLKTWGFWRPVSKGHSSIACTFPDGTFSSFPFYSALEQASSLGIPTPGWAFSPPLTSVFHRHIWNCVLLIWWVFLIHSNWYNVISSKWQIQCTVFIPHISVLIPSIG